MTILIKFTFNHGGMWVSAAGGTANGVAGTISRLTGVSYPDAHRALDLAGQRWAGVDWYTVMAEIQPFRWQDYNDEARFDARLIARAACREAA